MRKVTTGVKHYKQGTEEEVGAVYKEGGKLSNVRSGYQTPKRRF